MMILTKQQFEAIKADKKHYITSAIQSQLAGLNYRKDMENLVFTDDVANEFVNDIREKWDCSDWDEWDLVEWIRDIQHQLIEDCAGATSVTLNKYINDKFASQIAFATAQGVKPQQVTQWISKGFIVVDDVLYSPRRELSE